MWESKLFFFHKKNANQNQNKILCFTLLSYFGSMYTSEKFADGKVSNDDGESTEYSNPSDQDQNPDLDLIHNQRHR